MKRSASLPENGSTLVCALSTILVVSMIGAGVLMNCTTRFNATAKQVKGWKEALYAAEAGGDLAYAECRKTVKNDANIFSAARGWTKISNSPPTWTKTIPAFGAGGTLASEVTVDQFAELSGNPYYRIRAIGSARVFGLKRAGMDDRMNATTRGDSLLRKIDFQYDHFKATYGFGDALKNAPKTAANGKDVVAVSAPQVKRRIELIAVPMMSFEGAVKALSSFHGPGSAGVVDSYNSINGSYNSINSSNGAVANNPNHPFFVDARDGNVAVNTGSFNQGNVIYGNVSTNGGTITHVNSQITGVIDNNVPLFIEAHTAPPLPAGASYEPTSPSTINPPSVPSDPMNPNSVKKTEFWYLYTGNFHNIVVNPVYDGTTPIETEINVIVNGNVGDVTVNKGAMLKCHFRGNMDAKARDLVNNNVDGYGATTGVKMVKAGAYHPSENTSRAGHMQFYGINPPAGQTQTITIRPPDDVYAVFYAPGANLKMIGNPDVFGAVVCKSFEGNGNTGFHFDKALAGVGSPIEYRVAHYIEDAR